MLHDELAFPSRTGVKIGVWVAVGVRRLRHRTAQTAGSGGGGGIRTHDALLRSGLSGRCLKPLSHASKLGRARRRSQYVGGRIIFTRHMAHNLQLQV